MAKTSQLTPRVIILFILDCLVLRTFSSLANRQRPTRVNLVSTPVHCTEMLNKQYIKENKPIQLK
jgi:hypothetical protein